MYVQGSRRCLIGNALALVGVEVVAIFACADDAFASDAANGLCAFNGCAVLSFADALASTA
jgi:hypothetical protein